MPEPQEQFKFPRWIWLLVLIPFPELLLPRWLVVWTLPLTAAAALLGLLFFARKTFSAK